MSQGPGGDRRPDRIGADQALAAAVRQLDAAVAEQERAVTRILGLAELLMDHAPDPATRARVEALMEACGFQDITGQRIQKVSRLLRHVAQHARIPIPTPRTGQGGSLTSGPAEPGTGGLTQEQVDKLLKGGGV
jgi:chemotaxis regulatin CheY-phosphate phosphatase CheZ